MALCADKGRTGERSRKRRENCCRKQERKSAEKEAAGRIEKKISGDRIYSSSQSVSGIERWAETVFSILGDAIQAAEIQPWEIGEESLYKINDLEPEYAELLDEVKSVSQKLGRAPLHHEINEAGRQKLLERCGSWRNVLYQIGLEPALCIRPFSNSRLNYQKKRGSQVSQPQSEQLLL